MDDGLHAAHDASEHLSHATAPENEPAEGQSALMKGVVTVGVVGVAAALFEIALIPGMVLGVAAVLAPKYLPEIGSRLQPAFRSTVRGLYKFNRKARETVAEAHERMQDIAAEVHAEEAAPPAATAPHTHV